VIPATKATIGSINPNNPKIPNPYDMGAC